MKATDAAFCSTDAAALPWLAGTLLPPVPCCRVVFSSNAGAGSAHTPCQARLHDFPPSLPLAALQTELIGAGFMIGSAFAVILPEGFEVLYAGAEPAQTHATTHATTDSSGLLDASDTHSHRRNLAHEGGHEHVKLPCPRWAPGAALLAGFLAMMLFEYLHHALEGEGAHLPHGHVRPMPACCSLPLRGQSPQTGLQGPFPTVGPGHASVTKPMQN